MVPILQNGASELRKTAEEVPAKEIQSARIRKVLADMQTALLSQDDGVALAAPQIGVSLRIFIVSKAALLAPEKLSDRQKEQEWRSVKKELGYLTYINPVLTKLSRERALLDEGCLSVRPLYGTVQRSKKASVTAYDENGKKVTRGASGLLAQIFQHETDHLDGVLFIDKATNLRELPTARAGS